MITVEEAKLLIQKYTKRLYSEDKSIQNALGFVLSEDIISPIDMPPFHQSAMDGYALIYSDLRNDNKIEIVGEVAAGNTLKKRVLPGQAVRIFTGAPVPEGVDTVVMQEKVSIENNHLIVKDDLLAEGANVRKRGDQISGGETALKKGTILTPGGIGYLTALGITTVKVIAKPTISIIITGNELQKPGATLSDGQIYESNSFTLEAALQSIHLKPQNISSVVDEEELVLQSLKKAIRESDVVLLTGGISVGDYDFVGKSLEKLGVETIFYKIKQKPGKPLFFGKYNNTLIFALPGNPAAVLTCFYEYVFPALRIMQSHSKTSLNTIHLPIACDCRKKKGLSNFLKGKITNNAVLPLEGQESYILSSFAIADCLIYLSQDTENIKTGETVEVHLLPQL